MLKRACFIILCSVISIGYPQLAKAAIRLSDVELAEVSGAGSSPPLNTTTLPQDPQQPDQRDRLSPLDTQQHIDGMEPPVSVFAVLQSQVVVDRRRLLAITESAQQGLYALNLENQLSSDVTATSNIISGDFLFPDGVSPVLLLTQTSKLDQLYRQQGSFDLSTPAYHSDKTRESSSRIENSDIHSTSYLEQRERHESFHQRLSSWDVGVDKVASPSDFFSEIKKVELVQPWSYPIVPGFTIDVLETFTIGDAEFGLGAKATYSGATLHGFEGSFDGLRSIGHDILVRTTLKFPKLDLGDITLKGCIGVCGETPPIDLGDIGGTNILDILKIADDSISPSDGISFTSEGIVLENLAPQLDEQLNLNSGFVFAGKGHIELLEPATLNIGGKVAMTLTANAGFWLNLKDYDQFDLLKNFLVPGADWPLRKDVEFPLIDIEIPFTLVDIEIPIALVTKQVDRFVLDFDGVVVAQLGEGKVSADELQSASVERIFEDNSRIEHSSTETFTERSFVESYEHSSFTGGRMTGAEAELLAMSEGTLSVGTDSTISISSQAQQGMRVLHGVNAVSSLAANSLNLGQTPSLMRGTSGPAQISLQQYNQFSQQR